MIPLEELQMLKAEMAMRTNRSKFKMHELDK
jgi:hypothetical protein